MRSRILHVGVAKWLLLDLLSTYGAGAVLKGWTGTHDEAREAIMADPREYFVLSPDCNKQNADGSCAGHDCIDFPSAASPQAKED
jgi:hypothetical protein